jgi:hypothetical protein
VLVLLTPLRRCDTVESLMIYERINDRHRENITRYGFYFIDMVQAWASLADE